MRKNLLSFLDDCEKHGSETALVHRRGLRVSRWSYSKLRTTAFQFARELESRNISKGDRVLFWAENSPEWVAAFFGCLLRGVIVVPLDFESAPDFATAVQALVGIVMTVAIPYMINPDQANLRGKLGFFFGGLAALCFVLMMMREASAQAGVACDARAFGSSSRRNRLWGHVVGMASKKSASAVKRRSPLRLSSSVPARTKSSLGR
jgi:hypothetical protein